MARTRCGLCETSQLMSLVGPGRLVSLVGPGRLVSLVGPDRAGGVIIHPGVCVAGLTILWRVIHQCVCVCGGGGGYS